MDSNKTTRDKTPDERDDTSSNKSMERLHTWTPRQNFSTILNNPVGNYSYIEDIKNRLYFTLYDEKSTLGFEITKDFEKFLSVDIGSPRSVSSTKSTKISFKELLNEDLDGYIGKISQHYTLYKCNHTQRKNLNVGGSLPSIGYAYQMNSKIVKSISNEYFLEDGFKISREFLEKGRGEIEKTCRDLIEKVGDIEIEIERILEHSAKLYSYITNNLDPLNKKLNLFQEKICQSVKKRNFLREKFIMNGSLLIQKKCKQSNLKQISTGFHYLKKLKEILDLLRVLSTNSSKYQVTCELLIKGKELIEKMRNKSSKSVQILKEIEEECVNYSFKCSAKITEEFNSALTDVLGNLIVVTKRDESSDICVRIFLNNREMEEYPLDSFTASKILSKSSANLNALSHVSYCPVILTRLNTIVQYIFKSDMITTFSGKLSSLITKATLEAISCYKEQISQILSQPQEIQSYTIDNFEAVISHVVDTEKNDQLMLLLLCKTIEKIKLAVSSILNLFSSELKLNCTKKLEIIKQNLIEELAETEKIISSETNKIIHALIVKCCNNALAHYTVIGFNENCVIVKNIVTTFIPRVDMSYVLEKFQSEYATRYFGKKVKKIKESIEFEDWTAFQNIPAIFQAYADVISTLDYNRLKEHSIDDEIMKYFSNVEEQGIEQQPSCASIEINKMNLKLIPTTLEIIKVAYDSLMMLSMFSSSLKIQVVNAFVHVLITYSNLNKDIVLDGNGQLQSISQNEISLACANLTIMNNITLSLTQNDTQGFFLSLQCIKDLPIFFDNLIHTCKYKISDLIDKQCISVALEEMFLIDLPNYPVMESEVPINGYVITLVKLLKAIYNSMLNAFESSFIISTVTEYLRKFCDSVEIFMSENEKVLNESSFKQFKKDMIFLKKNLLNGLERLDVKGLKERVDGIIKKVLPSSLKIGKRKAVEEKCEDIVG